VRGGRRVEVGEDKFLGGEKRGEGGEREERSPTVKYLKYWWERFSGRYRLKFRIS
jgi:hypothetical protein